MPNEVAGRQIRRRKWLLGVYRRSRNSANSPLAKHLVCGNAVPSEDRLPMRISAGFVLLARILVSDGKTPRQAAKTTTVGAGAECLAVGIGIAVVGWWKSAAAVMAMSRAWVGKAA